ncbi:MAG: RNA polymerase subunit sigma-24 [Sphingobacteriales bacterium 41-5]|nr:MAG: RNA polymerase subunit sigma-24 [Sphingobacteriales bacterium 41-5]
MTAVINISVEQKSRQNILSQAVKKYGQQLFAFVRKRVNRLEDAEDVMQDVWYQLSNLSNIEEVVNIDSWLYRVSQNKIIDLYRKKGSALFEEVASEDRDGVQFIREVLFTSASNNADLELLKKEFWKELLASLDELPESQRLVFVQNELEDKTLQQIADEQAENLKTIISRKGYAVKYLRKKLLNLYNDLLLNR